MRKSFLLVIVIFFSISSTGKAQDSLREKNWVSIGYGTVYLDDVLINFKHDFRRDPYQILKPIFVKWMRKVNNQMYVGISTSFVQMKGNSPYFNAYTINGYSINLRINYLMFKRLKIVKPYFGFGLGFRNYIWNSGGDKEWSMIGDDSEVHASGELTFGLRFMPLKNFGIYVEAGLAKAVLQGGLTAQF